VGVQKMMNVNTLRRLMVLAMIVLIAGAGLCVCDEDQTHAAGADRGCSLGAGAGASLLPLLLASAEHLSAARVPGDYLTPLDLIAPPPKA
jgi:hypothetical protein